MGENVGRTPRDCNATMSDLWRQTLVEMKKTNEMTVADVQMKEEATICVVKNCVKERDSREN